MSIAVPILQSVIRHIERGGFGQDMAEQYQNFVSETQKFLSPFTAGLTNAGTEFTTQVQGLLPEKAKSNSQLSRIDPRNLMHFKSHGVIRSVLPVKKQQRSDHGM